MYGGALHNTLNLNNESDILNKYQTIIKTKDLFNQRKIETKNKSLLDKIKITNTKNQNAEYLIKYFEGMILNYINMYESKGENMDELKKFILNEDKYDKFKKENNNITNTLKGGYDSDDTNNSSNILLSMNDIDNNWGNIKIEYCRTLSLEYKIRISHSYTTANTFDTEINLKECNIVDYAYKIYNKNLFADSINITYLLKIIIKKLIDYDYNDYMNNINLLLKNGISDMSTNKSFSIRTLIKSIISTLILILTIRTGTNKNIYKIFNNTFLLSGISKFLLYNYSFNDYTNSLLLFNGTNFNQLTFEEKNPYPSIIGFHGDCTLNVLMCITKPEIKELLIEKINYIEKKDKIYTEEYYYNKIRTELDNFDIINGTNYTKLIFDYVNGYKSFINKIKNNEYQQLKNDINNLNKMMAHTKYIIGNINKINKNNAKAIYLKNDEDNIKKYIDNVNNNIKDDNIININNNYYNELSSYITNNATFFNNNHIEYIKNTINNKYIYNLINYVINYTINNINIRVKNLFIELLKNIHILRNNLLDYDFSDTEATNICENLTSSLISINNTINGNINLNNIEYITTIVYNEFIKIIDYFIVNHSDKFNIFYINLLLLLLITKYKIDYVFDDDIMDILKYSNNKSNIFNCFRNIGENKNEIDIVLPSYYERNINEKYLFIHTVPQDVPHSILSIIKIENNNKKIYLYDINTLNIICHEYANSNNIIEGIDDMYKLNNINSTLLKNKFKKMICEKYLNEINIWFWDIRRLYDNNINNLKYLGKIINNNNLLNIYNKNNDLFNNTNGKIIVSNILNNNYIHYNKYIFDQTYINIKREIFHELLNSNNLNNPFVNANDRIIIQNIQTNINNIIIDNKCTIRKLLFIFVKCLIEAKYYTNSYDKLIEIANCFNETYNLNANSLIQALNINVLKNEIINVINILNLNLKEYHLNGGYENVNYYNNSIIKKALIILLIILIIIIIVLIVLFIINKYKNNNFK